MATATTYTITYTRDDPNDVSTTVSCTAGPFTHLSRAEAAMLVILERDDVRDVEVAVTAE